KFEWPSLLLQEHLSMTAILGLLQANEDPKIDLIPSSIKSSRTAMASKQQGMRLGIIAGIALLSVGFSLSLNYIKQNTRLSYLESQIKESQKEISSIKQKKHQLNLLR